jgi:hypothetical protein
MSARAERMPLSLACSSPLDQVVSRNLIRLADTSLHSPPPELTQFYIGCNVCQRNRQNVFKRYYLYNYICFKSEGYYSKANIVDILSVVPKPQKSKKKQKLTMKPDIVLCGKEPKQY